MKRILTALLILLLLSQLGGCADSTLLTPEDPVALTMWHVYGEQADSPMNRLVQEFNETQGLQSGVLINVTALSNSSDIGPMLKAAFENHPGAPDMPDLFFCHANNAEELGANNLADWNELLEPDELDGFVPAFVDEGTIDGRLAVLPISKSTHMLFINGTQFELFSAATGVTYDDLATWDGFFAAAERFHEWSGGKAFCAFDYLLRSVELNAMAMGSRDYMAGDGWYDFDDEALRQSWMQFAGALVKGHIMVSDLYSNTQVMTGEVIAGMGSSAAILYYNDTVTYPDNTSEPIDLNILPMPRAADGTALATQAGVGLAALASTPEKAEAAAVFARWLTESDRNLAFVTGTGYMPVTKDAFAAIADHEFTATEYGRLYAALSTVQQSYSLIPEPSYIGYYDRVYTLYSALRERQGEWREAAAQGEHEALIEESWQLFQSVR